MKVFFAIWLDTYTLTAIESILKRLHATTGGRPMVPEAMHLTLSYVGEVAPERITELIEIGNQVHKNAFQFTINKIACFENPRIAWAGSEQEPEELVLLQAEIDSLVAKAGFPLDPRPFRPHVTLIRNLPAPLATIAIQPLIWPVAAFSLVQTSDTASGLPYRVLHAWPLKG